ncbi:MAG TPA: glycoside hydrolase family 15 protein, partial [Nonomuraea sp.]|nr:glycoside hydrolase family 15 protein [Nonomuraea sp.]
DASLLLMPIVGFLPADDPRVAGTVAAIEKELMSDGFVLRYPVAEDNDVDGLPGGEGAFLACSFWLVEVMAMQGRKEEAKQLFERLLALRNDVGLLAEEYDPRYARMVGNFPQAFSHVPLVHAARALSQSG